MHGSGFVDLISTLETPGFAHPVSSGFAHPVSGFAHPISKLVPTELAPVALLFTDFFSAARIRDLTRPVDFQC